MASEAAASQGKFWEYHDKLFANQNKLAPEDLKQYANDLGLNTAQFEKDLIDLGKKKRVDDDMAEARSLAISGTPAFFVNGHFLNGAKPFAEFAKPSIRPRPCQPANNRPGVARSRGIAKVNKPLSKS